MVSFKSVISGMESSDDFTLSFSSDFLVGFISFWTISGGKWILTIFRWKMDGTRFLNDFRWKLDFRRFLGGKWMEYDF